MVTSGAKCVKGTGRVRAGVETIDSRARETGALEPRPNRAMIYAPSAHAVAARLRSTLHTHPPLLCPNPLAPSSPS